MEKGMTTMKSRLGLAVLLGIFALALLAPSAANAQVTVSHVKVQVDGVTYCDSGTSGCSVTMAWTFPVTLNGGQTLVLTQTGFLSTNTPPGNPNFPNFDTSDKVSNAGAIPCNTGVPCNVSIFLDLGSGFPATPQYGPNSSDALNGFGTDTGFVQEGVDYTTVLTATNYKLGLGYADSTHPGTTVIAPCTSTSTGSECVPSIWDGTHGTTAATSFQGKALSGGGFTAACDSYCFDAGAILITGITVTVPPCTSDCVTVTQGGWGSTPKGGNPGAILAANFSKVFGAAGVSIGCTAGETYTFTSQVAVQNFLPQGGTPAVLAITSPNPLVNPTTKSNVFAGQVLALTINVDFSGPVFPAGLGSVVPFTSGPLAGKTVSQILAIADDVLGGCAAPPNGMTVSDVNDAVDIINNLFD